MATKTERIFERMAMRRHLSPAEKKRINKDQLKEWLRELRNPDNKQARGWLSRKRSKGDTNVGRCCLGLACHLDGLDERRATHQEVDAYIGRESAKEVVSINVFVDTEGKYRHQGRAYWTLPPEGLQLKLGIQYIQSDLVALNDDASQPYTVIANYVEKYMREQGVL